MNASTKFGFGILGAALVMGVLADGLLKVTPWGLNLLLWSSALLGVVYALARWRNENVPPDALGGVLTGPAGICLRLDSNTADSGFAPIRSPGTNVQSRPKRARSNLEPYQRE